MKEFKIADRIVREKELQVDLLARSAARRIHQEMEKEGVPSRTAFGLTSSDEAMMIKSYVIRMLQEHFWLSLVEEFLLADFEAVKRMRDGAVSLERKEEGDVSD